MAITVEAVYENGVLRLSEPLPFKEQEKVQVTVSGKSSPLLEGYGLIGWKGTHEELQQILTEAEEFEERP